MKETATTTEREDYFLVYQTSLVQAIQPNFGFFHIDGNGPHRSRQLDQSGLGTRWLFDIAGPGHAHLYYLAAAFGLSGGQGGGILNNLIIQILISTPNDYVRTGTTGTVKYK